MIHDRNQRKTTKLPAKKSYHRVGKWICLTTIKKNQNLPIRFEVFYTSHFATATPPFYMIIDPILFFLTHRGSSPQNVLGKQSIVWNRCTHFLLYIILYIILSSRSTRAFSIILLKNQVHLLMNTQYMYFIGILSQYYK